MEKKVAIITGASSDIGEALVDADLFIVDKA